MNIRPCRYMMGEFLDYFKQKRNLTNLLLVGIIMLALPIVVQTVRQQQIIKSRATNPPIVFTGDNIVDLAGGKKGFKLDAAGKAIVGLELNSPNESPVQTSQNFGVGTVYAGHTCPNTNDYCDGTQYCHDTCDAEGNEGHTCDGSDTCPEAPPPPAGVCTAGEYEKNCNQNRCGGCNQDQGIQSFRQCNGDGSAWGGWQEQCSVECAGPCQSTGGTIGSAADGPGGCCDPGAADNSAAGCRRDSNPGGFREKCDIANGACVSNTSCRSETGCALDTDCGSNKHCEDGQCKDGPPNKNCKVAKTIEARFNSSANLTVAAGTNVTAAVYRNGTGVAMAALVNGVTPIDTFSASVSGPGGFSKSVDPASSTSFIPTVGGKYTLTGTCGVNLTSSATLTVTGGTSPSPSASPTSDPTCPANSNLTVSPASVKVGETMVFQYSSGEDQNIAGDTWSAGIDDKECKFELGNRKYTCTAKSATDNGTWKHKWDSGNKCGAATYKITGAASVTTVAYRIAESPADFSETGKYGWQDYTSSPMQITFEFKDTNPGPKNVVVEFKYSDNKTEKKTAQIKLLSPDPAITGCFLSFEGSNTTVLNLTGTNFGTAKGAVKSGDTGLTIKEWKDKSVKAIFSNAPEGEKLPVILTSAEGQISPEGQCSAIAQLSLGAKVFCRTASSQDTANVDLVLTGDFAGGKKVKQKVSIDKEGNIQGLSQKLEDGKNYKLSLKAPKSVRKTVSFTAGTGTTNIPNFVLPVGDIAPAPSGDGSINALDKAALNTQWIIAGNGSGRTGDFNGDGRINSVDWACMRYDFGSSDDAEPEAPPAAAATTTTTTTTGVGTTATSGVGTTSPN